MLDFNDVVAAPVRYDLDEIVHRLRMTAESWVPRHFPSGRRLGDEWRLANIQGAPPRNSGSCVITLVGEHAGNWHEFDGGQGGGPLSTLEQAVGLDGVALFAEAARLTGWSAAAPAREVPPMAPPAKRDPSQEIAFILAHATALPGTIAARYLECRGLALPPSADLRCHPDLTHYESRMGYPALIGIVRDRDGEVVALHRTYLEEAAEIVVKAAVAKPRMMLGKVAGGAVRLAAALTAPYWEDRILGVSEMTRLPIRAVWIATGNNPTCSNEMARRIVRIRLDARVDQPWRRDGFRHADLMGWVRANRARLVAACLTLCQAWIAAGRPRGSRSIGSYDSWAQTMGGVLEVAGIEGFLDNLDEMLEAADGESAVWRSFVGSWWDRFGTAEVGTGNLWELALNSEPPLPLGPGNEQSRRTKLGIALGKLRDRVFRVGRLSGQAP